MRILSHALATAMLLPFFAGIGVYLYRLVKVHFPTNLTQQERASSLRAALAAATDALDAGVLTAGVVLGDRLVFPLVKVEQDALVRWSSMLRVLRDGVSVNGIVADSRQALHELLATARNNERLLRG